MARKALLNVVIIVAAVGTGLAVSARPWLMAREQRKIADRQIELMYEAEERHANDRRQEARFGSGAGREEMARRQGYRRKGEVSLYGTP